MENILQFHKLNKIKELIDDYNSKRNVNTKLRMCFTTNEIVDTSHLENSFADIIIQKTDILKNRHGSLISRTYSEQDHELVKLLTNERDQWKTKYEMLESKVDDFIKTLSKDVLDYQKQKKYPNQPSKITIEF